MAKVYGEEPTSGFVKPDGILKTDRFTDFTIVPSRGYSLLVRAKRHGRWWMLKGLKEKYRQDAIYQVLLQKEYEITSQLQHPMVVSVFSFEEVEGYGPCIVMEWIDGLTLREWLDNHKHTQKERRYVADMLLEALAYVHSRQTQHRDLKPSNVMITHDGQHLKLIDFGLSDTDSHTLLKAPAGTEGYMAPDGPSDIYSLGCILRELRLGGFSSWIVRRCLSAKEKRCRNVWTLSASLHRSYRLPVYLLLMIFLGIVAFFVYIYKSDRVPHAEEIPIVDMPKSTTVENDTTIEIPVIPMPEPISEKVPLSETKPSTEEIPTQIDVSEDIRIIESTISPTGIELFFDTVSSKTLALKVIVDWEKALDNMLENRSVLSKTEKDSSNQAIRQYFEKHYFSRWRQRAADISDE